MEGGVTWSKNSLLTDCFLSQVGQTGPDSLAAIHTDDFCCESLQQWDKHPVEEKQTELERENATVTLQILQIVQKLKEKFGTTHG